MRAVWPGLALLTGRDSMTNRPPSGGTTTGSRCRLLIAASVAGRLPSRDMTRRSATTALHTLR